VCSGKLTFATILHNLTMHRKQEGLGPHGTFDAFLATASGRKQWREGLKAIEADVQRLAPLEPGMQLLGVAFCLRVNQSVHAYLGAVVRVYFHVTL
jgi:hypothetical protein